MAPDVYCQSCAVRNRGRGERCLMEQRHCANSEGDLVDYFLCRSCGNTKPEQLTEAIQPETDQRPPAPSSSTWSHLDEHRFANFNLYDYDLDDACASSVSRPSEIHLPSVPNCSLSENDDLENLINIKQKIFEFPCGKCGNTEHKHFQFVEDTDHYILCRRCELCDHHLGVDDAMSLSQLYRQLQTGMVRSQPCICGNDELYRMTFEERNNQLVLICNNCNIETPIPGSRQNKTGENEITVGNKCDERVNTGNQKRKGANSRPGRSRVYGTNFLSSGDHITWHQPLAYWHHGIVVDVSEILDNHVRIIQYTGPMKAAAPKFIGGEIREEWQIIDCSKEEVYRIDYHDQECLEPEEVIRRARSRLGEKKYNLLTNNCEHFARWCKLGVEESLQASDFAKFGKDYANTLTNNVGKGLKDWMLGSKQPAAAGLKAVNGSAFAAECAANMMVAAVEVKSCLRDINYARKELSDNKIEHTEFINISIKRSCRSIAAIGGSIVGGILGNAFIPIPVFGGVVGRSLGYLLGVGLGMLMGKSVVHLKDNIDCKNMHKQWAVFTDELNCGNFFSGCA